MVLICVRVFSTWCLCEGIEWLTNLTSLLEGRSPSIDPFSSFNVNRTNALSLHVSE